MNLISIDPGLRHCGVALWNDAAELVTAGLVRSDEQVARGVPAWVAMAAGVSRWLDEHAAAWSAQLLIEVPRIYPAASQKGDQNDLIELAGVAGALAYLRAAKSYSVHPRDWKGTLAKELMVERVKRRLTLDERERVELLCVPDRLQHNIWDGVGIGLHHLGRLKPRRVYPGATQ